MGPTLTPSTATFLYWKPKAHSDHVNYTLAVTDLEKACPNGLSHIWGQHGLLPSSTSPRASQTSAHSWGKGMKGCVAGVWWGQWLENATVTPLCVCEALFWTRADKGHTMEEKKSGHWSKGPVFGPQNSEDHKSSKFESSSWLILTVYLSR